jgi:hypothetical protein
VLPSPPELAPRGDVATRGYAGGPKWLGSASSRVSEPSAGRYELCPCSGESYG